MPSIAEIRSQYPQYNDLSDDQLAGALHQKFYADMPREQFDAKIGYAADNGPAIAATPETMPAQTIPPAAPTPAGFTGPRITVRPGGVEQPVVPDPAQAGPQRGNLNIGVQGAAKGLGELAFGIPDLVNTGANLGLAGADKLSRAVGGPEIGYRFKMPSDVYAREAAEAVKPLGITTTDPAAMADKEKLAYNINRIGSQVAGAIPALARVGVNRAAQITAGETGPVWYDPLVRPYGAGASARTVVGDAAGAAGAGVGVTEAEKYAPDSPIAATLGTLGGGIGGVTAVSAARSIANVLSMLGRRALGATVERAPQFMDPATGLPASKKSAEQAAQIVQNEAVDPQGARARIQENRAALEPHLDTLPSSAALAEDPGLAVLERQVNMRQPGEAAARNREFQTGVRDTLDKVAPEGATAEPLIQRAQQEVDARRGAAQEEVDRAQTYADRTANVRAAHGEEVADYRGQRVPSSQALDREIVDNSLQPMDEARRRRYAAVPDVPTSGQPLYEGAQEVRAAARNLPPDARGQVLPADRLRDFEHMGEPIRDPETGDIIGYRDTSYQTLNDMRPVLAADKAKAREANAPPRLIDNIRALQDTLNRVMENVPQSAEANRFYNEDFAPVWGRENGVAHDFRKDVNKDRAFRSAAPPSETAERFLQPGAPEKTNSLARIFDSMPDPSGAHAATRQNIMAQLAETGVVDPRTGALRPNTLRNWALKNDNQIGVVPGLRQEIDDLLVRAEKGERIGGQFADELRGAQSRQKMTEDQINRGALRQVIDADPDKAVAAIMSNPNASGRRIKELIDLTAGDDQARNGLKAAVRDYLIDKGTTTASEKLVPGDARGPVSFAKMTKIFGEHENELAQIFSPEEMNTLRAGHKALELANVERLRVTSGSDTAEKGIVDQLRATPLGKGLEAVMRMKYGLLRAGGMVATARRLTSGVGSSETEEIARLVQRATVDPELMGLLLGRELPVNSPRWNSRMNALLGEAEFGRHEYEDKKAPPRK